jgi:hypothetical protein
MVKSKFPLYTHTPEYEEKRRNTRTKNKLNVLLNEVIEHLDSIVVVIKEIMGEGEELLEKKENS